MWGPWVAVGDVGTVGDPGLSAFLSLSSGRAGPPLSSCPLGVWENAWQ